MNPKTDSWWSERILFGLLLITGYIGLTALGEFIPGLSDKQLQFGRDGLLVLGPIVGIIAQAIWKTDKADKQNAETVGNLATAVNTAMALPPADPPPAGGVALDPGEKVTVSAAESAPSVNPGEGA